MSRKPLKDPKAIKAAFGALLNSFSDEEKLELEALAIGHAYLSEAQRVMDQRGMLRKELAAHMGISPSFLTQLFRGDRPLSDRHKALLQRVLAVQFEVKAKDPVGIGNFDEFEYPPIAESNYMLAWHKVSGGFEAAPSRPARGVDYNEDIAA